MVVGMVLIGSSRLVAQVPAPEPVPASGAAVLAGKGLKREGNLFLLADEIAARTTLNQFQVQLQRLNAEAAAVRLAGQAGAQRLDALAASERNLQAREIDLDTYIFRLSGSTDPNAPFQVNQARLMLQEARNQLREVSNSRVLEESEQRGRSQRLTALAGEVAAVEEGVGRIINQLEQAYQVLANDPEVDAAIRDLNRRGGPWATLGPQASAPARLAAMAERELADRGLAIDRKKKLVFVVGEAEFNAGSHRAWLLTQQLKGEKAGQSRRELAGLVPRLATFVEHAERTRSGMERDPVVASALAEYTRATGMKPKLTPSAEYTKNAKRIPDFQKLAGPGT
jgi:hypothetical protein